jgi:hypothetical protein
MDLEQLDEALPIDRSARTLTLTTSSVEGLLRDFLITDNGGQPMVISEARKRRQGSSIIVMGNVSLLNVASLPVNGTFTVPGGVPVAVISLTLPSPPNWTFSRSFPNLPPFDERLSTPPTSLLDALQLQQPKLVIATAAGTDTQTGAPLQPGLNFVSGLQSSGLFGLFSNMLGRGPLYGTITLPQPTTSTPPCPPKVLPWNTGWAVPGISLQIALSGSVRLGSSANINQMSLHIYTPTDEAWLASNPTYAPVLAVTGRLVSQGGTGASATAIILPNADTVIFTYEFGGQSALLSQLGSVLADATNLGTVLPQGLSASSVVANSAAMAVTNSLTRQEVQYTALQIGIPNRQWDLLPGVFTVRDIGAYYIIVSPFSRPERSVAVSLSGLIDVAGAQLSVVTQYPGFATLASLVEDTTIPLRQIFSRYAPQLPTPPDLTVDMMQVLVNPGRDYSFSARMADDPAWTLDLGPVPMTIGSVAVDVWQGSSGMQGTFTGTLEISAELELAFRYDTPGAFIVRADLSEVHLSQLIARLNQIGVTLPNGFDVDFAQSYVLIQEESGSLTFSVAALVSGLGLVAFTARKWNGQWGFAAGVELGAGALSSIPGLAALAPLQAAVALEQILLVASSLEDPGFQFPDMVAFHAPPLQGHSMRLPPQSNGVVRGVNVYATLESTTNTGLLLLASYLGVQIDNVGIILSVSAPDPATNSKLYLPVTANLNSLTTLTGQLGLLIQSGRLGTFLGAVVSTTLQEQPATFTVLAIDVPTGLLITGSMQGTLRFPPVQLSNLAILVGLNAGGGTSLGFAATISTSAFTSSLAILLDSVNPAKSLFAGSITDATLLSIATVIAGQGSVPPGVGQALAQFGLRSLGAFQMPASVAPALDTRDLPAIRAAFAQAGVTLPTAFDQIFFVVNTPGTLWHLTDLATMIQYTLTASGGAIAVSRQPQIYCAPQTTFIGSIRYPEGLYVNARIDTFLIRAQVQVLINAGAGITADVVVDPIQIVNSNFFTITGSGAGSGPQLSMSTFDQPAQPDPQFRPPHFLLLGKVRILGLDVVNVYVTVAASGLQFNVVQQIGPGVSVSLQGTVTGAPSVAITGSATVGINRPFDGGDLGRIQVTTTVNGRLDIAATPASARATVQGTFVFGGVSATIPPVSLDLNGPSLANLAETIWSQVVNVLGNLLANPDQWLRWLKDGLVTGVGQTAEQVGQILAAHYRLSGTEIANKTRAILGYGIDNVTGALKGAGISASNAANVLLSLGYSVAEVQAAIQRIFSGGPHADFGIGHTDIPVGPHVDTPRIPHGDTPAAPHGDSSTPHIDSPARHTDLNPPFRHVDTTIPHGDTPVTHVDTPSHLHVDTPAVPHVDTQTPHTDTSTHVDS